MFQGGEYERLVHRARALLADLEQMRLGVLADCFQASFCGRGSTSVVFKAHVRHLNHSVVVKVIAPADALGVEGAVARVLGDAYRKANERNQLCVRGIVFPALVYFLGDVGPLAPADVPPVLTRALKDQTFWTAHPSFHAIIHEALPHSCTLEELVARTRFVSRDLREEYLAYTVLAALVTLANLQDRFPGLRQNDALLRNVVVSCPKTACARVETWRYPGPGGSERTMRVANRYGLRVVWIDWGMAHIPGEPACRNARLDQARLTLLGISTRPHRKYDHHLLLNSLQALLGVAGEKGDLEIVAAIRKWIAAPYLGCGAARDAPYDPGFGRNTEFRLSRFVEFVRTEPPDAPMRAMRAIAAGDREQLRPLLAPGAALDPNRLFDGDGCPELFHLEPPDDQVWPLHKIIGDPYFDRLRPTDADAPRFFGGPNPRRAGSAHVVFSVGKKSARSASLG